MDYTPDPEPGFGVDSASRFAPGAVAPRSGVYRVTTTPTTCRICYGWSNQPGAPSFAAFAKGGISRRQHNHMPFRAPNHLAVVILRYGRVARLIPLFSNSPSRGCPILCRFCKGWDFTPSTQPHAFPSDEPLPPQPCGTPAVRTEESAPLLPKLLSYSDFRNSTRSFFSCSVSPSFE
jgi:hypothetical protein